MHDALATCEATGNIHGEPLGREGGATRFAPGKSGNPRGRPRKKQDPDTSAFTVILDQSFTIKDSDGTRELSAEEALQLRTDQDALRGSRTAQRTVMKMIAKREAWRGRHTPAPSPIERKIEKDDRHGHALQAMLVLGIARQERDGENDSALLEPWAVGSALARLRGRKLNRLELADIRVSTRDWPTLNIYQFGDGYEQ